MVLLNKGKELLDLPERSSLDKKSLVTDDAKDGLGWMGFWLSRNQFWPGVREALEQTVSAGIRTNCDYQ